MTPNGSARHLVIYRIRFSQRSLTWLSRKMMNLRSSKNRPQEPTTPIFVQVSRRVKMRLRNKLYRAHQEVQKMRVQIMILAQISLLEKSYRRWTSSISNWRRDKCSSQIVISFIMKGQSKVRQSMSWATVLIPS